MTPPLLARTLVTAVAPPADFESVLGDLQEEYAQRCDAAGRSSADRWYWSQALRSVPSLLAYSRVSPSFAANVLTATLVALLLVAMLVIAELLGDATFALYRHVAGVRAWPFFVTGWVDAAAFGAIIAVIWPSRGVRLTVFASLWLVAAIAIPIFLGFSRPLSAPTWLLLLGAVPAMASGTALFHVLRRH